MKTKNLVIIFILLLLITLGSGLAVLFTGGKRQQVINEIGGSNYINNQPVAEKKSVEATNKKPEAETANKIKPTVWPPKTVPPTAVDSQAGQIQAVMLINGVAYRTTMKPGNSVYDLMSALKEQKKLDFKAKSYSGLGFFVEEINGVKNDPAGQNWFYYVNGNAAQVGVSYYKFKNNDIIEWKYKNKTF